MPNIEMSNTRYSFQGHEHQFCCITWSHIFNRFFQYLYVWLLCVYNFILACLINLQCGLLWSPMSPIPSSYDVEKTSSSWYWLQFETLQWHCLTPNKHIFSKISTFIVFSISSSKEEQVRSNWKKVIFSNWITFHRSSLFL
jgi:hypothetical protein